MRGLFSRLESVQLDMWADTRSSKPDGSSSTAREWAKGTRHLLCPSIVFFDERAKRSSVSTRSCTSSACATYSTSWSVAAISPKPNFLRWSSHTLRTLDGPDMAPIRAERREIVLVGLAPLVQPGTPARL